MDPRSLEEDLRDIPGVEGAEIERSGDAPGGLRIRIAEGADQRAVGRAIREVLTKHGLGTDTRLPGEEPIDVPAGTEAADVAPVEEEAASAAAEPDVEPRATAVAVLDEDEHEDEDAGDDAVPVVVDLTDQAGDERESDDASGDVVADVEPPHEEVADTVEASSTPGSWTTVEPKGPVTAPSGEEPAADAVIAKLDRVAVEEARGGISVTVSTTDGRSATEPASSTEGGVEAAVVKAAARLARPGSPDPDIVEIEDRRIEGVDIVMIVLDVDGSLAVGAAIVAAGRSFALGRATWAALSM